jgi:hypothetical protein
MKAAIFFALLLLAVLSIEKYCCLCEINFAGRKIVPGTRRSLFFHMQPHHNMDTDGEHHGPV